MNQKPKTGGAPKYRLLFLILAFWAVFLGLEKPSKTYACECPFEEAENRTILHIFDTVSGFDKELRSDLTENDAMSDPINFSLPVGEYKITLASYNVHSNESESQPEEIWKLKLYNAFGSLIAETGSISDLEDGENQKTEVVNNDLSIINEVFSATAFHSAFPDENSPNGIFSVCAAFDRIIIPRINLEKTANPDSFPFGGGETVYGTVAKVPSNKKLTTLNQRNVKFC